jgi:hypothetical protein
MKPDRILIGLLLVLLGITLPQHSAFARTPRLAVRSLSPAIFTIPASNVSNAGPVMDEHHVVYGVASPRMHAPTCVSCGDAPFTGFHLRVYIRIFLIGPTGGIVVSQPWLLFTGPRGAQIAFMSFHHGWLTYLTYLPGDRWTLLARNVVSGRQILLDSPQREGVPSRFLHAGSDGRTVVWQSWTRLGGKTVSVIRSYSLITGQRRLLLAGGAGQDFFYDSPEISGDRLVFTREYPDGTAQLFLASLTTGRVRALTPLHQINREAAIAGDVLVWLHGKSTRGLVVLNLSNGHRLALSHSSAQLPRIAAGRYIVFATDYGHTSVQVYDTHTNQRRIIAGPTPSGGAGSNGEQVKVGGRVILYSRANLCGSPNYVCPGHIVLVAVP